MCHFYFTAFLLLKTTTGAILNAVFCKIFIRKGLQYALLPVEAQQRALCRLRADVEEEEEEERVYVTRRARDGG